MFIPDGEKRSAPDIRGAIHRQDQEIVESALCRLDRHFMFKGHLKSLSLTCQAGTLRVTGKLPSFYLKQVLQTALRDLPGVSRVDNRVAVVSSNGLSSMTSASENQEKFP